MHSRILVTSSLSSFNTPPSLSTIISSVLPADTITRYHRLMRSHVSFLSIPNNYGISSYPFSPLSSDLYPIHSSLYSWFGILFDFFPSSSLPPPVTYSHTLISQHILSSLLLNQYLETRDIVQLYCPSIKRFLSDSFIFGTCPFCSHTKSQPHHCPICLSVYESDQLINPYFIGDHSAIIEPILSTHLFLRLDLLQPLIQSWFDGVKDKWSSTAVSMTELALHTGLKSLCITTDIDLVTPLTDIISQHIFIYNWLASLIDYISISPLSDLFDPSIRIIQFIPFETVLFHTIIFPASLLGTNCNYNLVSEIITVNNLTFELGILKDIDEILNSGINHDYWRYYLLKINKDNKAARFCWEEFIDTCNADLSRNFSNLIDTVFKLIHLYCSGSVLLSSSDSFDNSLRDITDELTINWSNALDSNLISLSISYILLLSSHTFSYLSISAPWLLYDIDPDDNRIQYILGTCMVNVRIIINMLSPIVPNSMEQISKCITVSNGKITLDAGVSPIFPEISIPKNT